SPLRDSFSRIQSGKDQRSAPIYFKCGVSQGCPLSPILFDLAVNFLYDNLCSPPFANQNGYPLANGFDRLCLTGFADDNAVTSLTVDGARRTVELTQSLLEQIGLCINPSKSAAIHIKEGKLAPGKLHFGPGITIKSIGAEERIRYLGCNFNDEIVFDKNIAVKFTKKINKLITSPLLNMQQKINILNQYLMPLFMFSLQSAPLRKIPMAILDALDTTIRTSVKAIIGLPGLTATKMIYAPRRFRGLGVVNCHWEAFLQHFAIASKLAKHRDGLFHQVHDCAEEMRICKQKLGVEGNTSRALRAQLRMQA